MAGERILIVDDDEQVASYARLSFTLAGYQVEWIKDGRKAVQKRQLGKEHAEVGGKFWHGYLGCGVACVGVAEVDAFQGVDFIEQASRAHPGNRHARTPFFGPVSLQAHDVVRQVFHIGFTECLCHAGHVAGIVVARAGLEVAQLFHDVVVLLTGYPGDFILAGKAA